MAKPVQPELELRRYAEEAAGANAQVLLFSQSSSRTGGGMDGLIFDFVGTVSKHTDQSAQTGIERHKFQQIAFIEYEKEVAEELKRQRRLDDQLNAVSTTYQYFQLASSGFMAFIGVSAGFTPIGVIVASSSAYQIMNRAADEANLKSVYARWIHPEDRKAREELKQTVELYTGWIDTAAGVVTIVAASNVFAPKGFKGVMSVAQQVMQGAESTMNIGERLTQARQTRQSATTLRAETQRDEARRFMESTATEVERNLSNQNHAAKLVGDSFKHKQRASETIAAGG